MLEYRNVLQNILDHGFVVKDDRTGVGTINLNGVVCRFDLSKSFPIVNDRFCPIKMTLDEMGAFFRGETNLSFFGRAVKFWDRWAHPGNKEKGVPAGALGPVYGAQMRNFNNEGIDQLAEIVRTLKELPYSRRHLITQYNPTVLPDETKTHAENVENGKQVLPPCHGLVVHGLVRPPKEEGGKKTLDLIMYQRSADCPVGLPANIAYYAAMTHVLAMHSDMDVGELTIMLGSAHIYLNQVEAVKEVLAKPNVEETVTVSINRKENVWDYTADDFTFSGHTPGPTIEMAVAV